MWGSPAAVVSPILLRLFGDGSRGRRWRRIDYALRACDTCKVRCEESRRASYTDDRDGKGNAETVPHVAPGSVALEALRLGLKARLAREANSAAFMYPTTRKLRLSSPSGP